MQPPLDDVSTGVIDTESGVMDGVEASSRSLPPVDD